MITILLIKKHYGGLHLAISGDKAGYLKWAKQKNITIDYDKIYKNENPPYKYTGKLFFISKLFAKYVETNGKKTAENLLKYLGGSEDTFIAKMYSEFYKINWNDESKYKTDEKKFINFKLEKKTGKEQSLYIVNDLNRYIWYVNPKTASRTVSKYLNIKFPENYKSKGKDEVVEKHNHLQYEKYFDYFKFTIVRNPLQRLEKMFLDKTKKVIGTDWELPYFKKFADYNFEQFVNYIYNNVDVDKSETNRHIRSQWSLANECQDIDFIGKTENLEQDLVKLSGILNLEEKQVFHKNKTIKTDNTQYSIELLEKVYDLYKKDYLEFGY